MPLKNIPNKNRSRKHPGFNQASKAQRLRRKEEKRNRLSSSFFKEVACRKASTPCSKLVKRIVYGSEFSTAAMNYGLANEEIARKQYERKHSVTTLASLSQKETLCMDESNKNHRGYDFWLLLRLGSQRKAR
ncbi:hypothetical protein NPIL_447051 [Nephila pilipes]|uniref:Uncharacterized protein n=1 Tax=Nephila pilipes TaxID=299642 RepID=A0A8X6UVX0_NEPPI|nr:hypothetical protein NPIL_447051 [Nephila pilipes]